MKKDDSIDNFASLQMLGILSCRALNGASARAQHAMQILSGQRLPRFSICVLIALS